MPTLAPAPSEDVLLCFEPQFVYATESILAVEAEFDRAFNRWPSDQRSTPDQAWLIEFVRGPATGAQTIKPDGTIEYSQFTGTLTVVYSIRRDLNVASNVPGLVCRLDEKAGAIRRVLQKSARLFTAERLPWLAVTNIMPAQNFRGIDSSRDRELDVAREAFTITFEIRKEAWPVPA